MKKLKHKTETAHEFICKLKELSDLQFKAGHTYKGVAFKRAHKTLIDVPLYTVWAMLEDGDLDALPGIGESTNAIGVEFFKTGHIKRLEELRLEVHGREELTVPLAYTVDAVKDTIETIMLISELTVTGDARRAYERSTLGGSALKIEFVAPCDGGSLNYAFLNTNGMKLLKKVEGAGMDDLIIKDKRYPHNIAIRVYRNIKKQIGTTLVMTTGPHRFTEYLKKEALDQGYDLTTMGIGDGTKFNIFETKTEEEFFDVLGIGYVPCCLR